MWHLWCFLELLTHAWMDRNQVGATNIDIPPGVENPWQSRVIGYMGLSSRFCILGLASVGRWVWLNICLQVGHNMFTSGTQLVARTVGLTSVGQNSSHGRWVWLNINWLSVYKWDTTRRTDGGCDKYDKTWHYRAPGSTDLALQGSW